VITYNGPGKYVAICHRGNFDGHYVKRFEIPDEDLYADTGASWYFLNRVDRIACLEAVYPEEVFARLLPAAPRREDYHCPCESGDFTYEACHNCGRTMPEFAR
jgi:hypothetical protein